MSFIQGMETMNSIPYAGKTVTLSFYARAGANYSPTSNYFSFLIYTGTGTDQFPTSYTGGATAANTSVTLTTTWVRYTVTGTIATTATEIGLYAYWSTTGTAGTNDYVEITGVQLEVGSTATPFQTASGTLGGELALCQRYYYRMAATVVYSPYCLGISGGTTSAGFPVNLPVTMRTTPTTLDYNLLAIQENTAGGVIAVTSATLTNTTPWCGQIVANVASGLTQYRPEMLLANNSTSSYLGYSAEL
jgi:hypothetical protein